MSDDGYGGGGDDYDYESGPGCVTKKKKISIPLLIMLFPTSDIMVEHLCVSFVVPSNCVLVGGRS